MRRRLAVLVVAAAALAALTVMSVRPPGPDVTAPSGRGRLERRAARAEPVAVAPSELPERNVFEFAADGPARATPSPRTAPPVPPPADRSPVASAGEPRPVRLIGLVHRGGALRAALSILGNLVVLGAGEEAEGYRVLSIDEEDGVTLRSPDGTELSLPRPANP